MSLGRNKLKQILVLQGCALMIVCTITSKLGKKQAQTNTCITGMDTNDCPPFQDK